MSYKTPLGQLPAPPELEAAYKHLQRFYYHGKQPRQARLAELEVAINMGRVNQFQNTTHETRAYDCARFLDEKGIPFMPRTRVSLHRGDSQVPPGLRVRMEYPDLYREGEKAVATTDLPFYQLTNFSTARDSGFAKLANPLTGARAPRTLGMTAKVTAIGLQAVLGERLYKAAMSGKGPRAPKVQAALQLSRSLRHSDPRDRERAELHFEGLVQTQPAFFDLVKHRSDLGFIFGAEMMVGQFAPRTILEKAAALGPQSYLAEDREDASRIGPMYGTLLRRLNPRYKGQRNHFSTDLVHSMALVLTRDADAALKVGQLGPLERVFPLLDKLGPEQHRVAGDGLSLWNRLVSQYDRGNDGAVPAICWYLKEAQAQAKLPRKDRHELFSGDRNNLAHFADFLLQNPSFRINEKTPLERVTESMRKWNHTLQQDDLQRRLTDAKDLDVPFPENKKCPQEIEHGGWKLTRLNTTRELVTEGWKMHHCVGGYSARCARGDTFIYHGEDAQGPVTAELNKEGQLMQLQGPRNSAPGYSRRSSLVEALDAHIERSEKDRVRDSMFSTTRDEFVYLVEADVLLEHFSGLTSKKTEMLAATLKWLETNGDLVGHLPANRKKETTLALNDKLRQDRRIPIQVGMSHGHLEGIKVGLEPPPLEDARQYDIWLPLDRLAQHALAGVVKELGYRGQTVPLEQETRLPVSATAREALRQLQQELGPDDLEIDDEDIPF